MTENRSPTNSTSLSSNPPSTSNSTNPGPASASASAAASTRHILVTGGSSFIGRHLISHLLLLGHRVRIFDLIDEFNEAEHARLSQSTQVEIIIGDINSKENVLESCKGIDTVFHTLSLIDSQTGHHSPGVPVSNAELYSVNVLGTRNLISACIQCDVGQLIYTSTSSVIFNGTDIKNGNEISYNEYPLNYMDYYSFTKAEAEKLVIRANKSLTANQSNYLLTLSLRPHFVFGPGEKYFIQKLIHRARNGKITHIIGDGNNLVDFTYIDNVIHAHLLAMNQLALNHVSNGQCYFISNGQPILLWDFIHIMLRESGCRGPTKSISFRLAYGIAYIMELLRNYLLGKYTTQLLFGSTITRYLVCVLSCSQWFSHRKATLELGYRPLVTMEQGIQFTIQYLFQKRNKYIQSSQLNAAAAATINNNSRIHSNHSLISLINYSNGNINLNSTNELSLNESILSTSNNNNKNNNNSISNQILIPQPIHPLFNISSNNNSHNPNTLLNRHSLSSSGAFQPIPRQLSLSSSNSNQTQQQQQQNQRNSSSSLSSSGNSSNHSTPELFNRRIIQNQIQMQTQMQNIINSNSTTNENNAQAYSTNQIALQSVGLVSGSDSLNSSSSASSLSLLHNRIPVVSQFVNEIIQKL